MVRTDGARLRALARWGATRMPRWWLRYSPGPIACLVGGSVDTARRQIRENLRLVHGVRPAWVEALDIANTLAEYGHCFAEGLAAGAADPPPFRYTVEQREHLLAVHGRAKGAVIVTAHAGSWDVASGVMNLRGFELAIAMSPEPDAKARAISDAQRANAGVKVFHVGDDPLSALPLSMHLRRGGAVALQIDRAPPGMRTTPALYFGRRWRIPTGPFRLAQVTGAPILPVFTARLGFAHHLIHVDEPLEVPRKATPLDIEQAATASMAAVERFVRRFPTQWFNFAPHPLDEPPESLDDAERRPHRA